MSSSRPFCLVLCLLCTALPARGAEKPNDNPANNDSRSGGSLERRDTGYLKEWGGKSIHQWKSDLIQADPTARVEALLALLRFPQAADVMPDVMKRIYEDGDASVRIKAAKFPQWIRAHDTDRTRIIRALAHGLRDPQSVVRYESAVSLQSFCPFNFTNKEERDAQQDLVACLRSTGTTSSYEVREVCIDALIKARVDPKTGPDNRVTDALIYHANFRNEAATRVRVKAIMALGAQGRPQDQGKYQSVLTALKATGNFHSRIPAVRIWSHVAVIALEEKVNKKDLDTIAGYLKEREAAVRAEAVLALGSLEDKAKDYANNILDMLEKEKHPGVKANAALSLGRMGNSGQRVLNDLIKMTEDDDRDSIFVVMSACQGLVMIGVASGEVMRALEKVREHKSLDKPQKEIVSRMIEELQNPRKKQPVLRAPEKGVVPKPGNNKQNINRR